MNNKIIFTSICFVLLPSCGGENENLKKPRLKVAPQKITSDFNGLKIDFIKISKDSNVYLMSTEVSNLFYARVVSKRTINSNKDESYDFYPVTNITIKQAINFCDKLNNSSPDKNVHYRLPTKEEWIRACYSENQFAFPWGNESAEKFTNSKLRMVDSNSWSKTPSGIYNLWGNVNEWVNFDKDFKYNEYAEAQWVGGSFASENENIKFQSHWGFVHDPNYISTDIGFRVLLELKEPKEGNK
jgi:formylglycine-generating enzyme required for sulfatase activity